MRSRPFSPPSRLPGGARFATRSPQTWPTSSSALSVGAAASDAARRAAYDGSLEVSSQQPEARIHSMEIEDAPRSSAKWVVAAVIVLAVVTWWMMRDTPPPAELVETLPSEEDLEF